VAEFKRKPLSDITDVKGSEAILEPARLAPSGMNNQSTYYRGETGRIDTYYAKSMITDQMNQVNAGIGLCHIMLAAKHAGRSVEFVVDGKGEGNAPKGYRYVISAKIG
jgi:hypothetical protein